MRNDVQMDRLNRFDAVIMTFIRLLFPIWFAYLLIMAVFRIGVKKRRDRCVALYSIPHETSSFAPLPLGGVLLHCWHPCAELHVPAHVTPQTDEDRSKDLVEFFMAHLNEQLHCQICCIVRELGLCMSFNTTAVQKWHPRAWKVPSRLP